MHILHIQASELMYVLLIVLMILGTNAYAGVDFSSHAMTSEEFYQGYQIPPFIDDQDAIKWAEQIKWVEPVRRLLKRKIQALQEEAYPQSRGLTRDGIKRAGQIMQQAYYVEHALKIMEYYKQKGIKGTPGAAFYAGSIPL